MGTNSARPDNLDTFVRHSRAGDDSLESYRTLLADRIDRFTVNSRWATFQAGSLLNGFAAFIDLNGDDAAWVAQIASAFRAAGANGVLNVPDAAIEASLRAVGLDHGRGRLAYSDPIAFGMPPTTGYANDPVNTAIGNFVEVETDLRFTGLLATLSFTRTYNSCSDRGGPFGPRWSSWATTRLTPVADGVEYEGPDGQRAHFPREGKGFGRIAGVNALVERRPDGFDLAWFGGARWSFDVAGRPVEVSTGPGTAVRFTHDDGRLVALVHERGRRIDLRWSDDLIVAAVASDGREATYGYVNGELVEAAGDAGTRTYGIDGAGLIGSVTDADGVVELVNTYDEHGRVATQLSPFGRRTSFGYLPGNVTVTADDSGGPTNTFVHDRSGRLTAAIDGHDKTFRRHYDEWGNPVAIIERDGAVTVQEWDERARLRRRTLPSGAVLAYTYDDADRVLSVTTSDGAETRFAYAGAERIPAEVVDPEGGVTRLAVVDGVVREIVDPDGVAVVLRHDADGNVVEVVDADGGVGRIERDVAGRPLAAVSPAGRRTEFGYDQRGLLAARTDPDGAVWRYEHSRVGRPTASIDPLGARTELVYGEHGEVAEIVDALGARTLQQYDALGNLAGRTGPDGGKWTWTYDGLCRLSSTTDPAGATWLREYDVVGNLIGSIDPMGIHRTATFDRAGHVTSVSNGLTTVDFTSDAFGRATAQVRPDGTALRATYDRCGRRVTVTEPGGGTWRTDYTPAGRIRRIVSAAGREERFEYDRCGRLAATVDGTGARWLWRRNADGDVVARVWPTGDVEQFEHDATGRLLRCTVPGGGTTTYGYDACGRVTSVTDATGGVRGFARDALGRVVAATDPNGHTASYAYDVASRLVHVTDALGGRTTRTYDERGRLLTETDPLGRTTADAYDAAGRLLQRTDPAQGRVHWTYDTSGRVRDVRGAGATESVWVERDELGRPVAYVEPGHRRVELRWTPDSTLAERRRGDLALGWAYDLDGLRTAMRFPDGSSMTYDRDGAGRTIAVEHAVLGRIHVDRDAAGRLVGVRGADLDATWTYSGGALVGYDVRRGTERRSTRYERDAAGRVVELITDGVSRRFGHDAAGQLVTDDGPQGRREFAYDAAGRLTSETGPWPSIWSYDAAGQLVSAGEHTFGYDAAGRRVEQRDGDTVHSYAWDWLGRPTGVRTDSTSGTDEMRLLVDAIGELVEIDGQAVLWDTADPFSPPAWLDGAPVLAVGPLRARGGAGSPWLDTDGPGIGGDPWGVAGAAPTIGFRGELCVGGLVWLRDRMYDPATRAFVTPDPLPPVPGTAYAGNVYHYAGNNPVDLIDPLGRRPLTEADFQAYRDGVAGGAIGEADKWLEDNWEYVTAGALVIGGIALTAVGGPVGAVAGGGMISAGFDMAKQKHEKGDVDWGEVGLNAVVGMAAAPVGGVAGELVGRGAVAMGAGETVGMVTGDVTGGVVGGMAQRWALHEKVLDWRGMVTDGVVGGLISGGRLGTGHTEDVWLPPRETGAEMPVVVVEPTHVMPAAPTAGPESPPALPDQAPRLALPPGPPPVPALPPGPPQLLLTAGPQ